MKWLRKLFKPDPKLQRGKPPERPLRKDVYEHPDFTEHIKDLKATVRKLNIDEEHLDMKPGHRIAQATGLPLHHWRAITDAEHREKLLAPDPLLEELKWKAE